MICGSEMSIVLGDAPDWMKKTRQDLIAEKRSGKPDTFEPTRRMLWGTRCERRNIEDLCWLTGIRAKPMNVLLQSTRNERIGSTLDGLCRLPSKTPERLPLADYCASERHAADVLSELEERKGQFCALEAKQTSWLGDWKDSPPGYYLTQLQTQLFVTGLDVGVIFAKVGADDMRVYFVEADPFLHEEMDEAVTEFWKEVQRG